MCYFVCDSLPRSERFRYEWEWPGVIPRQALLLEVSSPTPAPTDVVTCPRPSTATPLE